MRSGQIGGARGKRRGRRAVLDFRQRRFAQGLDQLARFRIGRDFEFAAQQIAQFVIFAQGLGAAACGGKRFDQEPVQILAQRVKRHGTLGSGNRIGLSLGGEVGFT